MKPNKQETQLIGKWVDTETGIVADEVSERIRWLIANYLIKLATDETGWDVLYKDPEDARLWELSYPQSELHGGGPPMLLNISEDEARQKYNLE